MPDLARQLIDENTRTRGPFLDLANCGLTEVPPGVGALTWLESLSFISTRFELRDGAWQQVSTRNLEKPNGSLDQLDRLATLTGLRSLHIGVADVADLPLSSFTALEELDLGYTNLTDLSPLQVLPGLRTLRVRNAQVSGLEPLARLAGLRTLALWKMHIADLTPLEAVTGLEELDLSSNRVTDLTPLSGLRELHTLRLWNTRVGDLSPLAGLTRLRELHLSAAEAHDLSPLAGLTALQKLDIAATRATDLRPLAGLQALRDLDVSTRYLTDLAPVGSLPALEKLQASNTMVAGIEPLAGLTRLRSLDLSNSRITSLAALAGLTSLEELDVSSTPVADLSPLERLMRLRVLRARNTRIVDLAPLGHLDALELLRLSNTRVSDLAPIRPVIERGVPVLSAADVNWKFVETGIDVANCPLISPPAAIASQGAGAILNYFRERDEAGVDRLYEAKMLIVGEGGAGKTSLVRRLYEPTRPLPAEGESTKGIAVSRHEFPMPDGRMFRLNIWDFGGQEIYHATHQFFFTRRSLYVLVDDTRKDNKSVSDEGFKNWLELIDLYGGHSPVLIFQNEKGGRSKAIDIAGIKGRFDNVKDSYAGNLEDPAATDRLRQAIDFHASHLGHIGEELPARWIKVRADIEACAAERPYISQREFFDIYSRHMPFDRVRALHLSRYLHDLGVCLHYQDEDLLARTVILQNQWATQAVFRILDDEGVKRASGRFGRDDFDRLWSDPVYADMHPELISLMQRFELCYELPDLKPHQYIAPQLLPPGRPAALENWASRDGQDLVVRYRYDFMPKGLISRLTVRQHRFVRDPRMAWASGVLFERNGTSVLVEILARGREIEIRARGPERKALLSAIAADVDAINESIQGLPDRVDQWIPCRCSTCLTAAEPHFFAQKKLRKRLEDRKTKVECEVSYEEVDVLELLDGIRAAATPAWTGAAPRPIRIFLASSQELSSDRDSFDLYCRQLNDQLRKDGIALEVVRWEFFLDAMSETRLQDEYNKAICESDLFVSLFFTRTGKYTEEEFDAAHARFQATGRPRIYTFFKNDDVEIGSARKEDLLSLWSFQEKLEKLGHFRTRYNNIDHLKQQFRDQIDRLLDAGL